MTQGTQGNTRKAKAQPGNSAPSDDFSLGQWMARRGLVGERRMEVAGSWFRFTKGATADQLAAFGEAREKEDLFAMMASLLVDPSEKEELKAAFARQEQPIEARQEGEYLKAIIDFLIAGDSGESSAS